MSEINPRAARSRDAILEAFRQLMREKDYDKITVRDIFKLAGVGNGTFYRHFNDKEDLLTYAASLDLAGVYEAMEGAGSPYGETVASYRYIAKHPEMFRAILNLNVSDPLRQRVADAMCAEMMRKYEVKKGCGPDEQAVMEVVTGSITSLTKWYVNNLHRCTPEQCADLCMEVILGWGDGAVLKPRQEWLATFPLAP